MVAIGSGDRLSMESHELIAAISTGLSRIQPRRDPLMAWVELMAMSV